MSLPFISCKMITYGRVEFLEESLESFLKQDYPQDKCELIIVNDYPLQKLIFDHPNVKIYNLDETFATIGEKENFATSKCSGEIICQWDDDDLALSNHLQNVAKFFIPGSDLLHWNIGIFMNMPVIEFNDRPLGNSGIVFSKKIWRELGGHPIENAGYDMTFVRSIRNVSKNIVFAAPPKEEASWIYVWGGRDYHMSGGGQDTDDRPNVVIRNAEHIENRRKRGEIPIGKINLNPNWKYDYYKLLKDFNNKSQVLLV
jgi:glycosyltransferase involved in cell wall biosynthesis